MLRSCKLFNEIKLGNGPSAGNEAVYFVLRTEAASVTIHPIDTKIYTVLVKSFAHLMLWIFCDPPERGGLTLNIVEYEKINF